jgi:hypothetical protein
MMGNQQFRMEILATELRVVCDKTVDTFAFAFLCSRHRFEKALTLQLVK